MQGLLFLYDFRSIASSRSQMDSHLAGCRNGHSLLDVVAGCAVRVDSVAVDGHLIVSIPEERKVQAEVTRIPVGHGTDIPCVTAAAGRGYIFRYPAVNDFRLVPYRGYFRDESGAFGFVHIV